MKVLLTGGGTAGHINPALAIAEIIRRNAPGSEIAFVGIRGGKEEDLVPREGYPLYYVRSKGIRRSVTPGALLSNIGALWLAATSPYSRATCDIIRNFRPDIVIGTGGYACWPIMAAAARMGIPTALHESNAIAGVAVKMLQNAVDRIYLNFAKTGDTLHCDKTKILQVGNPIMSDFKSITRDEARKKLNIPDKYRYVLLSYGGSMGAEKVNDAMLCLMRDFTSKHPEVLHIHATGSIEWEECGAKFREMGLDKCENIEFVEYIFDMPLKMAAADLTITRAGAMTVTELASTGKCAIFIPSPNVAENHQYKNAKVLVDVGGALLFEEKDLTDDAKPLTQKVSELLCPTGDSVRAEMTEKIRPFALDNVNRRIYDDLCVLVREKSLAKAKKK